VAAAFFLVSILPVRAADPSPRQRLLLDFGWKFHLGDDWGLSERLEKPASTRGRPGGRSPTPTGARSTCRTIGCPNFRSIPTPMPVTASSRSVPATIPTAWRGIAAPSNCPKQTAGAG